MALSFLLTLTAMLQTSMILASTATCGVLPKFTAILVFGDSTVDSGNNNYISTLFRANHKPYGQDFDGRLPTGRFSNGKLIPDLVASKFGIKQTVPPFLNPTLSNADLITGVCFASAGSGFDDLTVLASRAITVSKQVVMFKNYIKKLNGIVGEEEAKKIVGGALVLISAGTNDLDLNFYNLPTRRLEYNIHKYHDFLLKKLQDLVKELYDLGCKTMVIAGLPPIGCLPFQLITKVGNLKKRSCLQNMNLDTQSYNQKLVAVVLPKLQGQFQGIKLLYSDIYTPLIDMIDRPQNYGFVETKKGCCNDIELTGSVSAGPLCNAATPTCENSSQYVFWDCIHPSQSTYQYIFKYMEQTVLADL